jgi:hypothetical protein
MTASIVARRRAAAHGGVLVYPHVPRAETGRRFGGAPNGKPIRVRGGDGTAPWS